MEATFKLLWKALVNAYDAGWALVMINILWFFLSFPLIIIFVSLAITAYASNVYTIGEISLSIPVFILGTTMAGMAHYTHELAHGESTNWKDFFVGIKKFFWPSMRYLLANLVFVFLVQFYLKLLNSTSGFICTCFIFG